MTNISKISTYDAEPEITTLGKFIRATMDGSNEYAKKVKRYRQTGEVKLKKSLPMAIVGAVCEGGHAREDIIEKTGWIALDIDAKDNPHLEDAARVRDAVGRLPFVAFAGLSVSGMGVWALVKIEDPAKQPQHFQQLQKDFEFYGITLDSTKGKNANDKRYYSFDPDAYVADNFDVYDRLPKVEPKPTQPTVNHPQISHSDKYAEAALNGELDILSRTSNGSRNNQLFKSTASLAQLVAGGVLHKSEVADALYDTARSIGLKQHEIKATITSGFKAGLQTPRKPAKNIRTKPLKNKDTGSQTKYETKKIKNKGNQPNKLNMPIAEFNRRFNSYPAAPF